jgi:hypothetical protein
MASLATELLTVALQIADEMNAKTRDLKQELLNIKSRQRAIEAELHSAHLSMERLNEFRSPNIADPFCPICLMRLGNKVSLKNVANLSDHPRDRDRDLWRCQTSTCRFEILADE